MSGLFSKPSIPQPPAEDPEIARQRKLEQDRAEADRIKATQDQLQAETQFRSTSLGVASLVRRRTLTSLLGSG